VQVRPFIERCPHSSSATEAGATGSAGWVGAGLTAGLAGVLAADDAADLSLYRASRIARSAASLLIDHSPDEL
jgi:hypothetical protein